MAALYAPSGAAGAEPFHYILQAILGALAFSLFAAKHGARGYRDPAAGRPVGP